MDPTVAGFLGGLVGGAGPFLAFLLQRRSEKSKDRESLVAAIRAVHSELSRDATALLTERPDEISTASWTQYAGELARQDRIGAALVPWGELDATYSKMRLIAEGKTEPSPQFADAVRKLADDVLDIAARAFDVHFALPAPDPPSPEELDRLLADARAAPVELPISEALEQAITSGRLGRRRRVRRALKQATVSALGYPAGDTSTPGQGSESNLGHETVNSHGRDYEILPIFTRASHLRTALEIHPDWSTMPVLAIVGDPLLGHVHSDVNLVINPWSPVQYILPAKRRGARLRSSF